MLEPAAEQGLDVDYVALIDPPRDSAEITDEARQGDAVLAVAARVGTTRLIDNAPLHFGQSNPGRSNLGRSNLGEAR